MTMTVTNSGDPRQFEIKNEDEWDCEDWKNTYVAFSGYFGSHNPNTFAAAPELLAALKFALGALEVADTPKDDDGDEDIILSAIIRRAKDVAQTAIAKAEAKA